MTELKLSPFDVENESDRYMGEFWINSGAFTFPVQGWHDNVPARLVDFAIALNEIDSTQGTAAVCFGDGKHRVAMQTDPQDVNQLRVVYADRLEGGLLYQEKIAKRDLQTEVARGLREMLEVCVRRRWSAPVATITDALNLAVMRRST